MAWLLFCLLSRVVLVVFMNVGFTWFSSQFVFVLFAVCVVTCKCFFHFIVAVFGVPREAVEERVGAQTVMFSREVEATAEDSAE